MAAQQLRRIPWTRIGRATWRALGWLARLTARASRWTLRRLWIHRRSVLALAVRGAWVASLLVLVTAGRPLFDVTADLAVDPTMERFFVGLSLCVFTVALARARRLRWAGVVLGAAHGALALALWSAAAAV